jgi:hypothetical protein
MTSRGMPNISTELHTNMSLLHQTKSMSSPSYLGFRSASISMVLVRSSTSICMALASSAVFKALDEVGMARLVEVGSTQRHSSLSSTMVTAAVASSMLFCSQSNAR